MNLIDYNKAVDALEKERQLLLNREQYGAEDIIVHHALNVIADLPIIRQPEIVRCKNCKYRNTGNWCDAHMDHYPDDDWFCADGERR